MRRSLIIPALALLLACGGGGESPTSPASASIAGAWTMRTVNGTTLPFLVQLGTAGSVTLKTDVLTIADAGTWSETYTYRQSGQASDQTGAASGAYTRVGTALVFQQGTATYYTGAFTGSALNLSDGTFAYVFTK